MENTYNGLAQLVNLPELHIKALEPSNSAQGLNSFSERIGSVVGMLLPFTIAHYAVSPALGLASDRFGLEADSVAFKTSQAGAVGFAMGTLLTPTTKGNDWETRLKNGAVDAGTFASMAYAGDKLAGISKAGELPLASRIVRSSLIGIGSGIPGGIVNAELTSLTSGHQIGLKAVGSDVVGFSLYGGLFGAFEGAHSGDVETAKSEIENRFPNYSADQLKAGRAQVLEELAQVKGSSEERPPDECAR